MGSNSLWLDTERDIFPQFQGEQKTDAVIIGGGITGLSTAYYLAKEGVETVLLEASNIGKGTTGHTTAHITSQHDMTYARWIGRFGLDKAKLIAAANEEAITAIGQIIEEEAIDCDFARLSHFLFTNRPNTMKRLEEENRAAQKLGIQSELKKGMPFLFPYKLAMEFKNQAQFHPVKYIQGLARAVTQHGGRIFEQSRVLHIEDGKVFTNDGSLAAKNIIVATHNPIINFPGCYFAKMYLDKSFCMSFDGAPSFEGMWNCADSCGHSYRMYHDKLIISGESHKCGTQTHINHYGLLKNFGARISKEMQAAYRWSAQDGITLDNLAYIGKYAKSTRGLFVATGFGKWGMTQSNIAGRLIRDLILERQNPYEEVFSPQRPLVPAAYWHGLTVNTATLFHFIAGMPRLGPPLCAHMKCRLKWTADEKTWDCPCHGSRFKENGSVIDSPAIHELKHP